MIINKKSNFLIFLVIFLVLSITPVSAELLKETQLNPKILTNESELSDDQSLKIDKEMNSIEKSFDSMKSDLEHIKNRFKDYNWKFWEWSAITSDIKKTASHISSTSEQIKVSADLIKESTNKIKETDLTDDSDIANDAAYDETDAIYMANELSKRLNKNITAKLVPVGEVKKGDMVQYMSQEKYPRYLEVVDIVYPENNTKTQFQNNITTTSLSALKENINIVSNTPFSALKGTYDITSTTPAFKDTSIVSNIPFLALKGTGSLIPKSQLNKYMEIYCNGEICTEDMLNTSIEVQEDSIETSTKKAEALRNKGKEYNEYGGKFGIDAIISFSLAVGLPILVLGIMLAAALGGVTAVLEIPLAAVFGCSLYVGFVFLCLSGVFATLSMVFNLLAGHYYGKANALEESVKVNQEDLNQYTEIGVNGISNMDVTTFDGIPIVKHPPMSDWKDYKLIILKNPDHGTLLPGPGLQFLYGPDEGYTGQDQFVFQYTKDDKIIGTIMVNATIQPIPVFTIPKEEDL